MQEAMKRVLVIGASSGIGRALVVGLRAKGIDAVACARRGELLAEMGGESFVLDVTAPGAVDRIAQVQADTVIFCAGVGTRSRRPAWELTEPALALNVLAFERVAQWAAESKTCKRLVAISSIAGLRGLENTNGYSPSKAYMNAAMEGYRRRWRHGQQGCEPVLVLPGFVDTALGQASTFWRCSPERAAACIIRGLKRRRAVIYVTPRWRLVAFFMWLLPRSLYERIPLP